jgi:hypothetical protein
MPTLILTDIKMECNRGFLASYCPPKEYKSTFFMASVVSSNPPGWLLIFCYFMT